MQTYINWGKIRYIKMSTTGLNLAYLGLAQTNLNLPTFAPKEIFLVGSIAFGLYLIVRQGYKKSVKFAENNGLVLNPSQSLWYRIEYKRTRRITAIWGHLKNVYYVLRQSVGSPVQISGLTTWLSIIPLIAIILLLAWGLPKVFIGFGVDLQIQRSTAFGLLQVESTISSLTFIVVIFILQYIEGQPHDERGMQTFVRKVHMLPIIFTTLLLLAGSGWIYVSNQPGTDQKPVHLSTHDSIGIILGAASIWILIVLIYVLVSRAILSETIDENIKDEIKSSVSKNIETEGRRKIAEGLLSVHSSSDIKDGTRDGEGINIPNSGKLFGDVYYERYLSELESFLAEISDSEGEFAISLDLEGEVSEKNPELITNGESKDSQNIVIFQAHNEKQPIFTFVNKSGRHIWASSNGVIQRLDKYVDLCTQAANEGNPSELKSRVNDVRDVAKTICDKCVKEDELVSDVLEEFDRTFPNISVEGTEMTKKVRSGLVEFYSDALTNEANAVHLIKQTGEMTIHSYQSNHHSSFEQYFKTLVAYHCARSTPEQRPTTKTEEGSEIRRVGTEVLLGDFNRENRNSQKKFVFVFTRVLAEHTEEVIQLSTEERLMELWELISELRKFISFENLSEDLTATAKNRVENEVVSQRLGIDFLKVANHSQSGSDPQMVSYLLLTELRFHMATLVLQRKKSDYIENGQSEGESYNVPKSMFLDIDDIYNFEYYFDRFFFDSQSTLLDTDSPESGPEILFGEWTSYDLPKSLNEDPKKFVAEVLVYSLLLQVASKGLKGIDIGDDPFGTLSEKQRLSIKGTVDDVLQSRFWEPILSNSEGISQAGDQIKELLHFDESEQESDDQFGDRFDQ